MFIPILIKRNYFSHVLVRFVLTFITGILFIYLLDKSHGSLPPVGRIFSPGQGIWNNIERNDPVEKIILPGIKGKTAVWMDHRLVPHIEAETLEDALRVQGYIHAKYRLWQMDMTSRLAGGRLSEIVGAKTLHLDREMRRTGMRVGALNSMQAMLNDSSTARYLRAYTAGVNDFIESLSYKEYPLEYKLMDFVPEPWTELKTCLILKHMANQLTGETEDFSLTFAKKYLDERTFRFLFPDKILEDYAVIRNNYKTEPLKENFIPVGDIKGPINRVANRGQRMEKPEAVGSNNWAIGPEKSTSGHSILCNDPHLPLYLPSIWFECHIHTLEQNTYGVSIPGTPGITIGFNENIGWGFTNGARDVKDFYILDESIKTIDSYDTVYIRGEEMFVDTIRSCDYGYVLYDSSFPQEDMPDARIAVRWMAHYGTNELKAILALNRSHNYEDYVTGISNFSCPHQNIVYADVEGNIAMWSQGLFVHKYEEQGRYLMGAIPENKWKAFIPISENPHEINPSRNYVMSANQVNTNGTYPFYYNGIYAWTRAKRLDALLNSKEKLSVRDMMYFQTDEYNQLASEVIPLFSKYIPNLLEEWNFLNEKNAIEPVLFDLWWNYFVEALYDDNLKGLPEKVYYPDKYVTLQILRKNEPENIIDDIHSVEKEELKSLVQSSYRRAISVLDTMNEKKWYVYKDSRIEHYAKIRAFGDYQLQIGGGNGIVNASTRIGGPSWRMIVEMGKPVKAYVVCPGGQSGNPLSSFYRTGIENWKQGKYFEPSFPGRPKEVVTRIEFTGK